MKFKLNKLKYIDLFGRRTELSMNGQKSHKTWCGTFCTIMIFTICAVSAIYYITQFFRRANPQYIYSEVYDSIYDVKQDKNTISPFSNLKIGSNGFFAMMGFENKDYNINEYKVQFTVLSQGKIVSEYKGINCSEIDYFQDLMEDSSISEMQNFQFVKENPQNFICLGNSEVDSLLFVYEAQSAIFIQLSCPDSQSCKSLNGQRVFILSSDYLVVMQDFSNPLDLYIMSNYVDLDLNYSTIVDVQLQKVLIQTDIGYLTTEYEYQQQVTFKDFKRYNQIRNPTSFSSPLLIIEIQPFSKRQIYRRSYPKFLSVLSIIGGLMKTLLVIGYFCTKPFSKISMRSELVNQLFTFEKISSKKLKKIHEIQGLSEENFNMDDNNNQKLPRSKTMTLTNRNQQKKDQIARSFEKLKDDHIKLQIYNSEQLTSLRNTPYSNYNLESNLNTEIPHSNLITARQFNGNSGQQKQFFVYPVSHYETQSIENYENLQTDFKQNLKTQHNDDGIRYSPIQKQYSNNSEILSDDQFNSANQNHANFPQILNSIDIGQKYQPKLFNKNNSFQKESQFIALNDNFIEKTNNYFKEQKIQNQNDLDNGNLKTFQTQYSQDLITQGPLTTQHNNQFMNHLDFETIKDKNNVTQSTKSSLKRLNQSRQLKHSLSQYDDNKGNQVDLQKQLEQKNLMQRRNANFDRDKKAFIKKETNRGSLFSIQDQTQNQDQEKDQKKQTSIKLTKNASLQKKDSIKPPNGQQSQAEGEQQQNGSTSRRIKSFFSSKTKEITDLIRFNINQRQQHNKEDETQKNNENLSNNQQSQSQSVEEKKKKHSNLIKQKTNKKFEGILNEKQEKSMILNIIDYVKYFFACFKDTTKVKQMKYTNKKVKKRLDIIYILEKLIEIDKLKVLLLNPDQINLFDYMPKEFVQFNSMENTEIYDKDNKFATWSLLCAEKSALDKYSNACIAYHHIQQNSNKTKIDKKLIQMLDPQVKRYFNKMLIQPEELNQYRTLLADYSLSQDEKNPDANQNMNQLYLNQQNELYNTDSHQQNIFNSQIQHNLINSNQPYLNQLHMAQSQNINYMSSNFQQQGINQFQLLEKSRNPYLNNDIFNSQRIVDKLNYSFYIPHEQQSTFSIQEKPIKGEKNQINLHQSNKSLSPKSTKHDPSKLSPDLYKYNKQSSPDFFAMNNLKNNKKLTLKYQWQAPIIEESNIFISSEQFGGSQKQPKDPNSPTQFPKQLEEKKSNLWIKRTQSIAIANQEKQSEERNNSDFDEQKSQIQMNQLSIPKVQQPAETTNGENNEEVIKFENTENTSLNQSEKLTTPPSSQMKNKNFKTNSNSQ
ncbi:transmembrane protein, putative (macronuclear) [Tetrahymena thermophila SB210]|uniref:Transmembrane protein, putative n=1 Tax=Tetrahymena thermophila (strain SB210) TaxID=312017 RepID=I7M728_TETTS|nr:transmembrane protein, putative [Tetrahymena thermophila SB210]EAR89262.2 transmembrane protein, putative [Tetrahymena thermophila SB210]|eukprot:XP_001009507.2 transmembrane protein, putative [Tetrahymena thermophila SB210]